MKQQLNSIQQDTVDAWELPNLFGIYKKGTRPQDNSIRIMAENAWLDGKDADANPFCKTKKPVHYQAWYQYWLEANKSN